MRYLNTTSRDVSAHMDGECGPGCGICRLETFDVCEECGAEVGAGDEVCDGCVAECFAPVGPVGNIARESAEADFYAFLIDGTEGPVPVERAHRSVAS